MTITVIPAQPGWCVVWKFDGKLIADEDVIAWAIKIHEERGVEASVYGITPEGIDENLENFCGYLSPDGEVYVLDDRTFQTLEQAQAYFDGEKKC